jgi:uncharacterized protein (TIGR03083 family)
MNGSELSTDRMLASIADHGAGFARIVAGHFEAPVASCPGWTVADLVSHVTSVHEFWTTIALERPLDPPPEDDSPAPVIDSEAAVERFTSSAARMVDVLRAADQSAPCWTWAPMRQDVGFITRHQVQEMAVHHWDAVAAIGGELALDADIAADAITEFLTVSVSSDAAPWVKDGPPLPGGFTLRATDADMSWHIHGGDQPATIAFDVTSVTEDAEIAATAGELLLWLFRRISLDTSAVDPELMEMFRRLTFTD